LQVDDAAARWQVPFAAGAMLAALALASWAIADRNANLVGAFFGSGALLMLSGLLVTSIGLSRVAAQEASPRSPGTSGGAPPPTPTISLPSLALRNAGRRRRRSVTTVALLASGCFVVAALGVFRLDATRNMFLRSAGTGGFALYGESALPIVHDLNTTAGREVFGLSEKELTGVSVVPMRVRQGDDASCLNLNRAQQPRLLGVRAEGLRERNAFSFAQALPNPGTPPSWSLLKPSGNPATAGPGPSPIPAIGDQASIQWALGKKVGDILTLTDDRGQPFEIQLVASLANSILQGSLLIDEAAFIERFPSVAGYQLFLIDAPSNRMAAVQSHLSRALQDQGLELSPASRRLAAFNAVQNTYLTTFQLLGGLGLLLGSGGLGVVVLRNVLERRAEMGLLLAIGLRPRRLRQLILLEHGMLLAFGIALGIAGAAVAVLPNLLAPGQDPPSASLVLTLAAVLLHGLFWVWVAVRVACGGSLMQSLRYE
jgi:hypothetical protein